MANYRKIKLSNFQPTQRDRAKLPVYHDHFNELLGSNDNELLADTISEKTVGAGISITGLKVLSGSQTGSDTPTINTNSGTIITAVTANGVGTYKTVTLTNSTITAESKVFVSIGDYGGIGVPVLAQVTPAAGSVVIKIYNVAGSALSAAFDIDFFVVN